MVFLNETSLPDMIPSDMAITLSGKSRSTFYNAQQYDPSFPQAMPMKYNGKRRLCYPTAEIKKYFGLEG
ncbi:hypothetical protein MNY64_18265 (plasmid) [Moellerella wisconsensis]|uniref:hypothetical protein n=1 Tax=Moellerella wisconsensis TaxID=158849 RepID=UPI001F4E5EF9|nr:hypothetical protein [Moellerella wisconsensis]UNH29344.1 hypothetical protein MNY64_18265 [Moellerella wisconsensis]